MSMDAKLVMQLRAMTGAGVLDAQKALVEANGNVDVAADALRKKGQAKAASKSGRETHEGLVGSYIHANGKVGVLLEVACETDFVARGEEFKQLVHDLAMHIAASNPLYLSITDIPPEVLAKEREIATAEFAGSGKPQAVIEKIAEGKLAKYYADTCLLAQPFVKDEDITVEERVRQTTAKTGEHIQVRRFCRFAL
ncbi:elongation factor Ts [Candidatus Uhrbacteria bacterium]|nr:elongation factor Ts [Candidatus Uhrbacteria bacterium]